MTTKVFSKLDWIQGEPPNEWEPEKVYIFECWATWCGPCLAAIPHVNELYQKYQPRGLKVFGIDVWEDGRDKVESFVKKKGEEMANTEVFIKLNYFPEPFRKLAESMEQGELPSAETLEQWSRAARQNKVKQTKAETP